MTALPPAGWFPDPETGGTTWRWWDGFRWAPPGWGHRPVYDPAAFARTLAAQAETTRNTGKWFRWAMAAAMVSVFFVIVGIAIAFHGGFRFEHTDPDGRVHVSGAFVAWQLISLPYGLLGWAYLALFIAWLHNAGKFADSQRWPAVRSRTLGAFSPLIPIVNLWWPYEAIRDLYPPGGRPDFALHWWLSYLIAPFVAFVSVIVTTLLAPTAVTAVVVLLAGGLLAVPVVLGWKLVDDLDAMQRAHSAPVG
jgi:hypothetical protein